MHGLTASMKVLNPPARLKRLFLVFAIIAGVSVQAHAGMTSLKKGATIVLPEFTLLDGTVLDQNTFKNKPVVLEFWASWCPYCARQNAYIQKLHEQLQDGELQLITVSIDKNATAAADYMAKNQYTFKAATFTPQVKAVFGEIKVIPLVFVIDKNSIIQEIIPGEMFEEDVMEMRKYVK